MSDIVASPGDTGIESMNRLTERLASVVPPSVAATLAAAKAPTVPQLSPAVRAGLSASAATIARAARDAKRSRSIVGSVVDSFVAACSFIPYALVALGLRFVIARVFFLNGQNMVDGPRVPINVQDFEFSMILPLQVKAQTFSQFLNSYGDVPVPPMLGAYLVSYAEFILPIFLVLGFATRFSALGLLIIVAMIQLFVMPEALWTLHVYWASILLVLLSLGPGQISIDHVIRWISRR
ncbi:MAG: DoxX family protein [Hyphomicrobiales bacterium]